ncbi:MAG: hypothetical protein AMXMBFR6_11550 [Betaproteobacteria bacterium]
MHHGRRAVIFPNHHFQAVRQSGFEGIRHSRLQRTKQGDDDDMGNEEGCAHLLDLIE